MRSWRALVWTGLRVLQQAPIAGKSCEPPIVESRWALNFLGIFTQLIQFEHSQVCDCAPSFFAECVGCSFPKSLMNDFRLFALRLVDGVLWCSPCSLRETQKHSCSFATCSHLLPLESLLQPAGCSSCSCSQEIPNVPSHHKTHLTPPQRQMAAHGENHGRGGSCSVRTTNGTTVQQGGHGECTGSRH